MLVSIHERDEQGNVFRLEEPFGLIVLWRERVLVVPKGFESDGASVPRAFWRVVFPSSDTQALRAAFAHDFVYRTHPDGWTKRDADYMFCDLLVEDGIGTFRALLAYTGVWLFGWWSWIKGGREKCLKTGA
jgi:hypothetical protein